MSPLVKVRFPLCGIPRRYSTTATSIQRFRDTMSSIANQTMILTAPHHNEENTDITQLYKGVTLSSVTSLSINPKPLLQFNLQKPSTTSEFLHSHKYFAIHILAPTVESASLARLFSRNRVYDEKLGEYVPFAPFKELEHGADYEVLKNDGVVNLEIDGFTLPILKKVEKVLVCKKYHHLDIQDHEIWIGEIKEIKNYNDSGNKSGGLLNFNREFHIVGNKID